MSSEQPKRGAGAKPARRPSAFTPELALGLLQQIRMSLAEQRPLGIEERRYLIDVCDRALADPPDADPLSLRRARGDKSKPAQQREVAKAVHKLRKAGLNLTAACAAVGAKFPHLLSAAATDGAIAKTYRAHRAEIERSDALYARRRQAQPVDDAAQPLVVLSAQAKDVLAASGVTTYMQLALALDEDRLDSTIPAAMIEELSRVMRARHKQRGASMSSRFTEIEARQADCSEGFDTPAGKRSRKKIG